MVALGIDLSGESSGLQASHPDPLQPLPDLNIGDRRVRRDRQHLVEQTDPSLRGAGPLRELLDQPVASVASRTASTNKNRVAAPLPPSANAV